MVSGGGGNIPIGHLEDKTNVSGEEFKISSDYVVTEKCRGDYLQKQLNS